MFAASVRRWAIRARRVWCTSDKAPSSIASAVSGAAGRPRHPCSASTQATNVVLTSGGKKITRRDLFRYTNGRFLKDEESQFAEKRFVEFDIDELCQVVTQCASREETDSKIVSIRKIEGGFCKVLVFTWSDESEVIAKIPMPLAGLPCLTTESEVAVLQYLNTHTNFPVPRVLAWSSNTSNPVQAEYIIIEKAPGTELFHVWEDLSRKHRFSIIKQLTKLESQLLSIVLPASGSLYLKASLPSLHARMELSHDIDPEGRFCVGPSCERSWASDNNSVDAMPKGPWISTSSHGIALAERELRRVKHSSREPGDQIRTCDALHKAISVLDCFDDNPTLKQYTKPALWHTDLHLGNIFVSDDTPPMICSLIDWQSTEISSLFLQARWPVFLDRPDQYPEGLLRPQLADNFAQLNKEEQKEAKFIFDRVNQAKGYEMSCYLSNEPAYRAMTLPRIFKELFLRIAEVAQEGSVPLRECLLELEQGWSRYGFTGHCPYSFSAEEIERHQEEFAEHQEQRQVQKLVIDALGTDAEGWVSPELNFTEILARNRELFEVYVAKCIGLRSREQCLQLWPFAEALERYE